LVKGVAEIEGNVFFEAAEDGVVFDELFDAQVGEMSVEMPKLFYLSLSFRPDLMVL
jgi:hypothetical protein